MFQFIIEIIEGIDVEVNKILRKTSQIIFLIGLIGVSIFVFLVYYENNSGFEVFCFGITEIIIIYFLSKSGLSGCIRFFGIMCICVVIYSVIDLIKEDYSDGLIFQIGYYVAAIVLTKIPDNIIRKWLSKRTTKRQKIAIQKKTMLENESYENFTLDGAMLSYYFLSQDWHSHDQKLEGVDVPLIDFYLAICLYKTDRHYKMEKIYIKHLCHLIGSSKKEISRNFLQLVINQCSLNKLSYLILTTANKPLKADEWPILFKADAKKAEHVEEYLNYPKFECNSDLFDRSIGFFDLKKFMGLFNCLVQYRYKVEDAEKKFLAEAELKRLYIFAVECEKEMIFCDPVRIQLKSLIDSTLLSLLESKLIWIKS